MKNIIWHIHKSSQMYDWKEKRWTIIFASACDQLRYHRSWSLWKVPPCTHVRMRRNQANIFLVLLYRIDLPFRSTRLAGTGVAVRTVVVIENFGSSITLAWIKMQLSTCSLCLSLASVSSFIPLFRTCILGACPRPGTVLGSKNTSPGVGVLL